MRRVLVALVVMLVGLPGAPARTAYANGVGIGDVAPALDGKVRRGWVLVTFCATWCKPCLPQMAAVDKLARKYGKKVRFVAVLIDGNRKRARSVVKALRIKQTKVIYAPLDSNDAFDRWVMEGTMIPAMFTVDPDGIIRSLTNGFRPGDETTLEADLDSLLPP